MITVIYGGDSNFSGSTSPALTQTVTRHPRALGVLSSVNLWAVGQTMAARAFGSSTEATTAVLRDGTRLNSGVVIFNVSTLPVETRGTPATFNVSAPFTGIATGTQRGPGAWSLLGFDAALGGANPFAYLDLFFALEGEGQ